ncbi:MAG: glycosyltransferase [Flammeovirgaceae bacterium]
MKLDVIERKRILAFMDFFYPAVKVGGPAKSTLGFVEYLSNHFDIVVVTSSFDYTETQNYEGINPNICIDKGGYKIYYLDKNGKDIPAYLLSTFKPQIVYLHSFFSFAFTIKPLILLRLNGYKGKIIIATRGELAAKAFGNNSWWKKKVYVIFYKIFIESQSTIFHVSSDFELVDVIKIFPKRKAISAPDLRPKSDLISGKSNYLEKNVNELRMCLISRIHPIKNIDFAILSLSGQGLQNVSFDIFGYKENEEYYNHCKKLASESPCKIRIFDEVKPSEIIATIQNYHLFFMPSMGENFGHSILESFIAYRPVLISDRTPWRSLMTTYAGIDAPLDMNEMRQALKFFLGMNNSEFQLWCKGARGKAENYFNDTNIIEKYLSLFE